MTTHERIKLADEARANLAAILDSVRLPREVYPALDGVLLALRQLWDDDRRRLEEFAKGNERQDPEPF